MTRQRRELRGNGNGRVMVIRNCSFPQRAALAFYRTPIDRRPERARHRGHVINSSAEDTSLAIAKSFSTQLAIRAFRRPDLLPWMAKTNFGVEQAKGNWICMLHQDDFWRPNRSAELQKWLLSQPDAVMHLHPCYIVDEVGRRPGLWRCPPPADGSPVPAQLFYERLLVQNFIGILTPAIRRATLS